jgi:hypothetical protein
MTDTLDRLRADFPTYVIDTESRPADTHPAGRQAQPPSIRFVAVRREHGPGPHTVITPDPDELRAALGQPARPATPPEVPGCS